MPTKITKNSFQGGIDKDTDPKQVKNITYSDGYNVSLSQDGKEKKLSSFYGTTILSTLIASGTITANDNIHVMGMYEAKYLIDSVEENAAIVFTYNAKSGSELFSVFAVKEDGTVYTQYSEAITLTDTARFVDCVVYKEGGKSYAYFTDYEKAIKKLPCVITSSGKGDSTPYTREEILLLRTGFRGGITGIDVQRESDHATWKGDLLNGTYQFALRLFNNTENKYTKWGLFTNPVTVGMGYSTTEQSYGGVGYVSDADIALTMTFQEDYTALYTHFQIAVIENINGGNGGNLTAKVLQPEALSDAVSPYNATYSYATNKIAKELITVEEIVVDDAAIKAVKTLAIKNNRLLMGNVKYRPLDYDHGSGDPIIGDSTAATNTRLTDGKAVAYRDPDNATNKVGHFRGELYRYAVVYEDEFGNFSRPKVLDFSSTAAAADSGIDCKFPERNDGTMGTLLEANGDIQALGLNIVGLDNHPTWAVAAHIVRAPRKKKVLFQTPLVPSILVQPAKAVGDYPDQRQSSNETETLDPLNVEAANPEGSFVPKNFFHVLPKSLIRFGDFYGFTPNGGSVISTVYPADIDEASNTFLLKKVTSGTSYNMPTEVERTLYSASADNDYSIQVYLSDSSQRDIISGDQVTVDFYSRTIGTSSWGTPENFNYTGTLTQGSCVAGAFSLDTTINDYKFEVQSTRLITV